MPVQTASFGDTKLNSFADGMNVLTEWELSIMSPKLTRNFPETHSGPRKWFGIQVLNAGTRMTSRRTSISARMKGRQYLSVSS